jgi:5-methylcytosine-specific restriction endonuclease McrA
VAKRVRKPLTIEQRIKKNASIVAWRARQSPEKKAERIRVESERKKCRSEEKKHAEREASRVRRANATAEKKERARITTNKSRERRRDQFNAWQREYAQGRGHHLHVIRRARRRGSVGFYTNKEWEDLKAKCEFRCQMCGRHESERKLTVDHIVPVSRGGSSWIQNIQPLCKPCNSRKGNRMKSCMDKEAQVG